jgi:hypothetical protein
MFCYQQQLNSMLATQWERELDDQKYAFTLCINRLLLFVTFLLLTRVCSMDGGGARDRSVSPRRVISSGPLAGMDPSTISFSQLGGGGNGSGNDAMIPRPPSSQQQQQQQQQQQRSFPVPPPLPLFSVNGTALTTAPTATSSTLANNTNNNLSLTPTPTGGLFPPLPLHMLQPSTNGGGHLTSTSTSTITKRTPTSGSTSARSLTKPRGRLVQRVRAVPPMALMSSR